jgi:pimeloyl-ACP methyl ester carboxylesterase
MHPAARPARIRTMERVARTGGALAADVDRRAPRAWWVCAHGFGSDRRGAKASVLRAAAADAGVSFVAFDARGHGASTGPLEELTLSRMIEDLATVVEAFVPERALLVVIGSSLGGLAAAWYAAEQPARVSANVPIAPAFRFVARFLEALDRPTADAWRRTGVLPLGSAWMPVALRYDVVDDARTRDEATLAARYRTRTRILHGTDDRSVPSRESTEFAARCPHGLVEVVLLEGGDHRLEGRGAELVGRVETFLGRGPSGAG